MSAIPACHAPIPGTQNLCTRDRGHDGEHRCTALDVDTRKRTGSAEIEKWGVLARRSSGSQFGAATAWCKDSTAPTGFLLFATHGEAAAVAEQYNARALSPNVSYIAARYE